MFERGDNVGVSALLGNAKWVSPSSRTSHDNCASRFAPAGSSGQLNSPSTEAWAWRHRPPAARYSATIAFGIRPRDGTRTSLAAAHSRSEPTSKPRSDAPSLALAEARLVVVRLVAGAGLVRTRRRDVVLQRLAQPSCVLLVQVDLVGRAIQAERDGLHGWPTSKVVDQSLNDLSRHARSPFQHRRRPPYGRAAQIIPAVANAE